MDMQAHKDGMTKKKKKSNKTTVEKTISEEVDNRQDFVVEYADKERKKRRRAAGADAKELTKGSLSDDADGKRKKKRRKILSPEANTSDHYDAHKVTDQAHVDLMEQDIEDQLFQKDLNNEKRRKCKEEKDRAITVKIDSSGEGKVEDDVVLNKSSDIKEEPPADTDAKKKRLQRTRRRNKKLSKQKDTIENPVPKDLEVSDQEDCFINETITPGRQRGKIAAPGKMVSVEYVGMLKNDTVFEDTGYPVMFTLGNKEVMEGWEVGISGMRVGEVRRLIVPPSMGFGAKKIGSVPPNSTLKFEVKLLAVYD